MEKDKISIIVPVFNLENYIENCIKSLIAQTYNNIEIILINDGSTDNSAKILDKYSRLDKRIKLIHKNNEGVSKARNTGLNESNGKYITFVDGDDTVDENYVEFLYRSLIDNNADISICGHRDLKNENIIFETKDYIKLSNNIEALKMLFETNYFSTTIWAKMYKRELFNENRFDETVAVAEDLDLLYRIFEKANVIYINTKERHYNTLIRSGSASRKGYNQNWKKAVEVAEKIVNNTKDKFPDIKFYAIKRYIRINFACIKMILSDGNKEYYKEIKTFTKNIKKYVAENEYKLNKKEKFILICANNKLLRKLYQAIKK